MRNRPYRSPPWIPTLVSPVHIQQPSSLFSTLSQNLRLSAVDSSGISSAFDIDLHHIPIISQHYPPVPCVYWHIDRRLIRMHKPPHLIGERRIRVYHPVAKSGATSTDPYEVGRAMQSGIRVTSHTPVVQARRNTVQWFPAYYASRLVALTAQYPYFP